MDGIDTRPRSFVIPFSRLIWLQAFRGLPERVLPRELHFRFTSVSFVDSKAAISDPIVHNIGPYFSTSLVALHRPSLIIKLFTGCYDIIHKLVHRIH